ncbi:MAG TPA: M23 family metallopeptidase [Vicinamibacterales bacterium]|jgi:murein DD-endopeptidase MepM/ murein hydrolase activator NlpD|nr:M23 family metallopeptidase [Vicinamibacterales bacterium]
MRARRFTVVIADRSNGRIHRIGVNLKPTFAFAGIVIVCSLLSVPVLMGLGAKWSARGEIDELRTANSLLRDENNNYRAATGELTGQIQSLEGVLTDLGARSLLDPAQAKAMSRLPALVKSSAAGGAVPPKALSELAKTPWISPEDTFGALRDLLQGLENRLTYVRKDVERREALAAATPSIWPTQGWLAGSFGERSDPFTGEAGFHQGIDISADKGTPVLATADGLVESASYSGDYGNLIVLKHQFGLSTRYAHLSAFGVKPGQRVKRGEVIGFVGSTGRSTGAHLHYEITANGRLLNPLQLLTQPAAH